MNIKQQQEFLKARGYYTGNVDGVSGKLTKQAIKQFQKSQHITSDGIWGKNTQAKATILNANNWAIGSVKFTYYRVSGEKQIVYVNESILLTNNFRLSEFMENASTIKKYKIKSDRNVIELYEQVVLACQMIRNAFGKSCSINSGYRDSKYNKAIGGATKSQHIYGKAVDLVVNGVKPSVVQNYVRSNYQVLGIHGMESKTKPNCNQYTHIDIRAYNGLLEF